MKIIKRLCIWLAGMLVILAVSTLAGSLFTNQFGVKILMPAMVGYAKKLTFPLDEPTNEDERKKVAALLGVRALLDNQRFSEPHPTIVQRLLFQDITVDESVIFTAPGGLHDFSKGTYASVLDDSIESVSLIKTIGLIDMGAFVEKEGADALFDTVQAHPDAVVRLDAYTIDSFHIQPVTVTVVSESGEVYLTQDFPADGEVIRSETCRIQNDDSSLYQEMLTARAGERATDRIAEKMLETLPYGQAGFEQEKTSFGLGSVTASRVEIADNGYGMITVLRFNYCRSLLLYVLPLGAVMTVVMLLVFLGKDRKK